MRVDGDRLIWSGGELIRLHDGAIRFGADFIPDGRGRPVPDKIILPVQAYLLRRPGGAPVLIDTGCGDLDGPDCGHLAAALAALGIAPEEIGDVLFTHLHSDHCGGLRNLGLANARLHIAAAEVAHWAGMDRPAARLLSDHAERITPLSDGDEVVPGVTAWALPGHTPGHTGFVIDGQVAVVGDMLHRADLQLADPRIATRFDVDPAQASDTRIAGLARIAERGLVFCSGHGRLPGQEDGPGGCPFLRIAGDSTGWRARMP